MDPYKVLGVSEDANKDQLKKAYRKLAAQHHPDKGGDEDKFKEVNEAYSILSDNQKSLQYHAMKNGPQMNMEDLFGAFGGFGLDPFADLFNQAGPPQRRKVNKNTQDKDIIFNLNNLTFENIKKGATKTINFQRNVVCKDCNGQGGEDKQPCQICAGAGVEFVRHNNFIVQQITCRTCGGAGHGFVELCPSCQGDGFHRIQESVQVEIKEKK